MFCTGCGNDLTGTTGAFCPKCGAGKATQQNSGYPQYPQHGGYQRPQSGKGMAGRQALGAALAVIGIILFIIGISIFNSGEQQLMRAFGYSGPETVTPILLMVGGGIALVIGVIVAFKSKQ